jgi:hypothetical protein
MIAGIIALIIIIMLLPLIVDVVIRIEYLWSEFLIRRYMKRWYK